MASAGSGVMRNTTALSAEVRAEGNAQGAESVDQAGIVELIALVRSLQEQLVSRTEAAAMWQERAGTFADRLALADGKLAQLAAPQSLLDASTATQTLEPSQKPPHILALSVARGYSRWLADRGD